MTRPSALASARGLHLDGPISCDAPPAVVVGLCGHGLALARALHTGGVRVLALEANSTLPGTRTSLADVIIVSTIHGEGLLAALLALRERLRCPGRPVLYLTNDAMVRAIGHGWDRLEGLYALSWSHGRHELVPLLDKPALEARCRTSGVDYPQTFLLASRSEVSDAFERIGVPMIVKPARPLSQFKTAQPDSSDALRQHVDRFIADLPFIVQRCVPGDDTAIHFSALYLERGKVLARFDGRKLRSRPLGHTSIAEAFPDDAVHERTLKFFQGLELSGPVSLELKRDPAGKLWVIEPTVGRTDFWVGLCIENGVNLPLIEYWHQTGQPFPAPTQTDSKVWFNEDRDPFGRVWVWRERSLGMRGRGSAFVFLHRSDPAPAFSFVGQRLARRFSAVGRRLLRAMR